MAIPEFAQWPRHFRKCQISEIPCDTYNKYNTGGPCYMREIGTPKIDWHIMNLHLKRPKITVN